MNWNSSTATLVLNELNDKWYSFLMHATCCYSEIHRSGSGSDADNSFELSDCIKFQKTFELPAHVEFILVKCHLLGISIYKNTHAIIREKPHIRQRLDSRNGQSRGTRPLSVLMLAIDSMSRLNLLRAMPRTAQHLSDTGWFELQGYNKIGDNTYPNIMAIMTGYNLSLANEQCQPDVNGKQDECPFVWKDFQKNGYVTAYGEDETSMSSFNFYRSGGFRTTPTDYYMRPYILVAEQSLPVQLKHDLTFCLGDKHSVEHVYDYGFDFARQYRRDPSFGLFWTNTFSHNDVSDPSIMDERMLSYMDDLHTRNILNESMVIFFSDHGIRFGPMRQSSTGWLEERLPFIFIWLPPWFRNQYPEIVHALDINQNRLTNPYDLHMTLKHVLQLANPRQELLPPISCPNCQSLFYEVPWNRSCDDCSIPEEWCACASYVSHNKSDAQVKNAVQFVIEHLNSELTSYTQKIDEHVFCANLTLKMISNSRKAERLADDNPHNVYIVVFQAAPSNGWFEATVRHLVNTDIFQLTGLVSRLDKYAGQSDCIKDKHLQKYCYCI